jgi:hypothetical protein
VIPPSQRERESTTSLSSLTKRERESERKRECAPCYLYGLNRNITQWRAHGSASPTSLPSLRPALANALVGLLPTKLVEPYLYDQTYGFPAR